MNSESRRFDKTLRRAPDMQATLRRDSAQEATLRRGDRDADIARAAARAAEDSEARGQVFPCELGGRRIDLTVERALGAGGEGELYLCRGAGTPYVAKILRQDSDGEVLTAMVAQREDLETRHLVPCLYVGSMADVAGSPLDRRTYVVHPYYEGGDLASLANTRRINPSIRYNGDEKTFRPRAECYVGVRCDYSKVDEEAFGDLVSQLAEGLRALHEASLAPGTAGAVHRDIKPQNIFTDAQHGYALGDFGLISAMSSNSPMKFTQRIGLSHGYSPPEAYSDRAFKQTVTRKYDYFSLGMTLLHIVGGRPRYIIDDELARVTPEAMTLADFYETIMLSAVSVPEDLPPRIRNLIRGLLAADPDDRWGEREVGAWLGGQNPLVPDAHREAPDGIALRIHGHTEKGSRAVAAALLQNWEMCSRLAAEGELKFDWDDPDPVYRDEVEQAVDIAAFADPDIALQTIILTVYRKMGHVLRGRRFETDQALGDAMTKAAAEPGSAQFELLRDYLLLGALSNTWNLAGSSKSDTALRTLLRLEQSASANPCAAMYAAGALLSGQPVPETTVCLGQQFVTFSSAQQMAQWVEGELAACEKRYDTAILTDEPPRIPGRWVVDGKTMLRQIDGSILLDDPRVLEPVPVSGALLSLARLIVQPGNALSDQNNSARLLAMLCAGGYIADVAAVDADKPQAPDGFMPWVLIQFLALFPQARTRHEWDAILQGMLRSIRRRLRYISGVRTPSDASSKRVDTEVAAVSDAGAQFERSAAFTDFADAVQQANRSRQILADLKALNYAGAQRILQIMPSILSAGDPEAKERFYDLCRAWASTPGDRPDLIELSENLTAFEEDMARRSKSDLSPYLLTDTMLFIRNYNNSSAKPLDIMLPDTTDAAAYYAALCEQVRQKRSRLVLTGLVDEDGNVLR